MRAEIVGVGTELLLGEIPNTNAQTIALALAAIGVDCTRHVAVGDNEERIAAAVREGLERADAVIVTGGLGPTQDDVTREAIARACGRRLVRDERIVAEIRARFERMGREMPSANERQGDVVEGGEAIANPLGTAPGLRVAHEGAVVYALPGVPSEMVAMLEARVLPELAAGAGGGACIVSRIVRTAGLAESAVAEQLAPVWSGTRDGVTLAYLAGGGEVRVRLTSKAASAEEALARLRAAEERVRGALGAAVVGVDEETLEAVALALLRSRGWRLACAESVTGGLVAARLTAVPGASAAFAGGIVAYEARVKEELLGVDAALLAGPGAVSAETARAMASGVRARTGADVGLATTGVAGPAEHGAPVGTVFIALDGPDGALARGLRLPGDREAVRALAVAATLNLLRLHLLGEVRAG